MNLSIGIVGLPNVGKSTLFKALTKQNVEIANYPFATIDPHVGVVAVPDERLLKLTEFSQSKKNVPAVVEFVDIAGLVKGAAEGAGLGNKFLSNIKEVDAIAEVVRIFEDKEIIHQSDIINPASDIDTIEYELILKDLETAAKRAESLQKDAKSGNKDAEEKVEAVSRAKKILESGKLLTSDEKFMAEESFAALNKELQLLTSKKIIYVFNASEKQIQENWKPASELAGKIGNAPYAVISAKIEAELADLGDDEREEFLGSLGLKESGLNQLIRVGYRTLNLITFFTTGEDESRAWTIPAGSTAPRAGRAIHSDFEEKFIRAEVIAYDELIKSGSWKSSREKGLLRTEGKEYIVKDGDVVEFLI